MNRLYFLIVLCFLACENFGFDEDPIDDPVSTFEVFWQEFDKHYSFFELKRVNWDSVYQANINKVDRFNLFQILEEITLSLKDGQVNLYADDTTVSYDFTKGHVGNRPLYAIRYLRDTKTPNNRISYSRIKDTEVGYIRVLSFEGQAINYQLIDQIVAEFSEMKGIVIDVRSNRGGNDGIAILFASRFADQKRLYRKIRYRNGPKHDDFTPWNDDYIVPHAIGTNFLKPVVVLCNKSSIGATEDFILSMRVMPNVQIVGGVTGGVSGNLLIRDLPNGWYFRLPHRMMATPDDQIFEGIGLEPDHYINITEEDILILKDRILEKAIELLF